MKTFKAGDLVYCPKIGTGVYTLERSAGGESAVPYVLKIETVARVEAFTDHGYWFIGNAFPVIFKATEKNRKRLSKLYGVEFD